MKSLPWASAAILFLFFIPIANAQPGCAVSVPGMQIVKLPPVAGAPFSADIVRESTHFLHDGNRIVEEQHGKIYRDSKGRGYCEMEDGRKTITVMEISDPVARLYIRLNPQQKIATVVHHPKMPQQASPASQQAPARTLVKTEISNVNHKQEALSSREVEGFTVTGNRSTNIIPAGQAGNDKPMTSIMEAWYSSDLKIMLLSTNEDPRFGKTVDKVVNIHPGEPDPSMFRVPDSYTVKDKYCRAGLCNYDSE